MREREREGARFLVDFVVLCERDDKRKRGLCESAPCVCVCITSQILTKLYNKIIAL